jgi:tryptophan synthase alpha chain
MTRLAKRFEALRSKERKALVVYLTAGDPDLETSIAAARAALAAGADILEIGVPFSDPVADGPVIQRAMLRALDGGGGLEAALTMVKALRSDTDAPLVLFGYVNPLLWSGLEASCKRIAEAGADGMLVVDVPVEEADELRAAGKRAGLDWVGLVAPTTGVERAGTIARAAAGFVYVVSMTGVTGGALSSLDGVRPVIRAVRDATALPVCIGFGVRDRASAHAAAALADGVVVGSAVVAALEAGAADGSGPERVRALVRELRAGVGEAA